MNGLYQSSYSNIAIRSTKQYTQFSRKNGFLGLSVTPGSTLFWDRALLQLIIPQCPGSYSRTGVKKDAQWGV
jgi:hypothetical protein